MAGRDPTCVNVRMHHAASALSGGLEGVLGRQCIQCCISAGRGLAGMAQASMTRLAGVGGEIGEDSMTTGGGMIGEESMEAGVLSRRGGTGAADREGGDGECCGGGE